MPKFLSLDLTASFVPPEIIPILNPLSIANFIAKPSLTFIDRSSSPESVINSLPSVNTPSTSNINALIFIKYRITGITYTSTSVLLSLDRIQSSFWRQIGISPIEALFHFNLAPLETRRDIAMLAVIHRSILGQGRQAIADRDRKL